MPVQVCICLKWGLCFQYKDEGSQKLIDRAFRLLPSFRTNSVRFADAAKRTDSLTGCRALPFLLAVRIIHFPPLLSDSLNCEPLRLSTLFLVMEI